MVQKQQIQKQLNHFVNNPGYLLHSGWLRSMSEQKAVDMDGRPIPWITYPAIAFIEERLKPEMSVFEYGTGNSTLWWSSRVRSLVSCEHDKEWYAEFCRKIPAGVTYLLRRAKGGSRAYADEITHYHKRFDIIVIDGRERVKCVVNCLPALRRNGIIIWDNSDREEYLEGYDFLHNAGFKRLDFWGMGALATRYWCTSIFYRQDNCFAI